MSLELCLTNILSALLLLHSFYRSTSTVVDKESADHCYREVTELTSNVTLPIARRLKEPTSSDVHTPCPLLLDWMYRSVIAYHDVQRIDPTAPFNNYLQTVREAMEELSSHWTVGGIALSSLLVSAALSSTLIIYLYF